MGWIERLRRVEPSGVALDLKTGVPTYRIENEEGRTHLLIHLAIEEQNERRWCLWRQSVHGPQDWNPAASDSKPR
jgi:hypothetical protein